MMKAEGELQGEERARDGNRALNMSKLYDTDLHKCLMKLLNLYNQHVN